MCYNSSYFIGTVTEKPAGNTLAWYSGTSDVITNIDTNTITLLISSVVAVQHIISKRHRIIGVPNVILSLSYEYSMRFRLHNVNT